VGVLGWLRRNLFSNLFNSLLTIIGAVVIFLFLRAVITWAVFSADWSPMTSNLKLFAVGQYPEEQLWRVGVALFLASLLAGLSWAKWGGVARTIAIGIAIGFTALALLPLGLDKLSLTGRIWMIGNTIFLAGGYFAGKAFPIPEKRIVLSWIGAFVFTIVILLGFGDGGLVPAVPTRLWGGLLLTFLLAVVGITASFPLGVLLALGRRSDLKLIKLLSVGFIEVIRGVPLITLLFMSQVAFPLFLPSAFSIDRVIGALFVITLFSAAYMAENIRGGLQAVPVGQIEAARALGLSGLRTTLFIVLPQALRSVIPAIVGQFISLFKDTSLVAIVGLLDILGIGKSVVLGNIEWVDAQREVFIFVGLIFWIFTFTMSYASRKLEDHLGVGTR
jgi:general L-amino acid transport system permease protein